MLAAIQTAQGCAAAVRSRPDVASYIRRVNGPGGTATTAEPASGTAPPGGAADSAMAFSVASASPS